MNGKFAGPVNTNPPHNLQSAIAYDGSSAFLDLSLLYRQAAGPLAGNQQQVADTLANVFNGEFSAATQSYSGKSVIRYVW